MKESIDNHVKQLEQNNKGKSINDSNKLGLGSMGNLYTIDKTPIDNLPLLATMVNFEGDSIVEGFIVVENVLGEYNFDSFKTFMSSPKTLKGVMFSNWFYTILDNMIEPLVDQSHNIIDKDFIN